MYSRVYWHNWQQLGSMIWPPCDMTTLTKLLSAMSQTQEPWCPSRKTWRNTSKAPPHKQLPDGMEQIVIYHLSKGSNEQSMGKKMSVNCPGLFFFFRNWEVCLCVYLPKPHINSFLSLRTAICIDLLISSERHQIFAALSMSVLSTL